MATADNATMNQQTLYEPLSKEKLEIRVLDLEHSADYDSDLHCKLRKISLRDLKFDTSGTQTFEALSYTWGDTWSPGHIFVNEKPTKVTHNLESFLRHRREADRAVTLWIDAITINQEDKFEKNYQIPLMNLIYGVASKLTIWLGVSSDDSSLAFELLHNLGRGSPYSKTPLLDRKSITAVQNLLSRSWWTRVWIVQELVTGGMGIKQDAITIQCGNDSARWANFVISAARMKAYSENLRQSLPNIDNILELDSLRESAFNFLFDTGPRYASFDLLCRYRHFCATNARDKLYAIYNMFSRVPSKSMPARYDSCVTSVYVDFAIDKIRTDNDLEILRHCGQSKQKLPSWVPDWSIGLGTQLLPLKSIPRYLNVPWWANPVQIKSDQRVNKRDVADLSDWQFLIPQYPRDAAESASQRNIQFKRLKISAEGFGIVNNFEEIPPDFTFHNLPNNSKKLMQENLGQGRLVLAVQDERCLPVDSQEYSTDQPNALRQEEIRTERSMKTWLLQELVSSKVNPQYLAARTTKANIAIDRDLSILRVKGILWETVEMTHDSFLEDLTRDWKDTTRFMVAVGLCKALALAQKSALERYPDVHAAFWSTLFAGQVTDPDQASDDQASQKPIPYAEWLPLVPSSWDTTIPPLTSTTTGLLNLSESLQLIDHVLKAPKPGNHKPHFKTFQVNSLSYDEFNPELWPSADQQRHKTDLAELASMWYQQPYDLYHRPFSFLHIVPDPYWETRKHHDERARQLSQQHFNAPIVSPAPTSWLESLPGKDAVTKQELQDYMSAVKAESLNRTSMVPKGTFRAGVEQYALGRQFFVTKGGYFGLGPKGVRKGDRVVVLFGSSVPFILRKYDVTASNLRGWQLIGETYVHGAMQGEVIGLWELGALEAGTISLR